MKEEKEFYSIGRGSLNLNGKFYYGLDYAITDFMRSLEEENKSLQSQLKAKEDNWNYIKKMLKEARNEKFNINGYCGTCTDVDIDFLLNKMEELEILSKGDNK